MPISFNCACGERLEVDDELAGKQARCPYCEAVVNVPAAQSPPQRAKRARVVEPDETHDDHGAYAGSLNPLDRNNRRSSRRVDDDDRPSRRRRRDEEEDDEDDDDHPRRRRRDDDDDDDDDRPRRSLRRQREPAYNAFNKQTIGGCVMMLIGVSVTVVLLFFDIIWWWMLILTVVGVISLIRGLVTGRDQ